MDIAKYIGKFLIKNKYCSLPGLGVFELKKIPAYELPKEMQAPAHNVTFTPVGSIDDTFASYIASIENVSISNASNNIKEFCKQVKDEISKTGFYEIEQLGKLSMPQGKLVFQQSDDLDLGMVAAPVTSIEIKPISSEIQEKIKDDFSYPPATTSYKRHRKTNWIKIIVPVLIVIVLVLVAYFGYDMYKKSESEMVSTTTQVNTPVVPTNAIVVADSLHDTLATLPQDSINQTKDSLVNQTVDSLPVTSKPLPVGKPFQVAVFMFDNEAAATAKANKLKGYGNQTSVLNAQGKFIVSIMASHPTNDTTKIVDSLRRFFNPKGNLYIIK